MEFKYISDISIPNSIEDYFNKAGTKNVNIVIIGANNGDVEDFLTPYIKRENATGLMVEPVKYLFKALKKKFKGYPNLSFENAAVFAKNCKKKFYTVAESRSIPKWTTGLGSFDKKNILKHAGEVPKIKDFIKKETVDCITFDTLVRNYSIDKIDILQIDVEGYDFDLLRTIDFNKHRPSVIIVEILHLTIYEAFGLINLLSQNNYSVNKNVNTFDLIAIDNLQVNNS